MAVAREYLCWLQDENVFHGFFRLKRSRKEKERMVRGRKGRGKRR